MKKNRLFLLWSVLFSLNAYPLNLYVELFKAVKSRSHTAAQNLINKYPQQAQQIIQSTQGTPLLAAAINTCHYAITKILVDQGAPVNGQMTLKFFARDGATNYRDRLVSKEYIPSIAKNIVILESPNIVVSPGNTEDKMFIPVHGFVEYLTLSRDVSTVTPLMLAALCKDSRLVQLLLDNGANPNIQIEGINALGAAVVGDNIASLQLLLNAGADPTILIDDREIVNHAAYYNKVQSVAFLTQLFNDIDALDGEDKSPLIIAIEKGHTTMALYLISKDAVIDVQDIYGNTALHYASQNGQDSVVQALLTKIDVNIRTKNQDGRTALMLAVAGGHTNVVQQLLAYAKANAINTTIYVNILDNSSKNALDFVSKKGSHAILQLLVNNGANINRDVRGMPLLIWSTYHEDLSTVQYLISQGTSINIRDSRVTRRTALMAAALRGYLPIVQYLVEQGASINLKDRKRKTALDHAKARNQTAVITYLESQGAI